MEVGEFFISPDGVHVGVESFTRFETVFVKGEPFPLRQGMDHLRIRFGLEDVKGNRAFHSVEVVVDAGCAVHKQRGSDPFEVEGFGEFLLKCSFDEFNSRLGVIQAQRGLIVLGNEYFAHRYTILSSGQLPLANGTKKALQVE